MNERVSILMILLIIFLLIICNLVVSAVNEEIMLSGQNTFSGGLVRPSFLISPVRFSDDRKIILIYKQGGGKLNEDDIVYGIPENAFADMLSFIDRGRINYDEKVYPVFQLKLIEEKEHNIVNTTILDEDDTTGVIDHEIIENIISKVWPGYNYEEAVVSLPSWFEVEDRSKIYYESISDDNRKIILIGDFAIEVTNGLSNNDKFLFDTLATSIMDFVYLGECDLNKRIEFFKEQGNPEANEYYKRWNDGELKNAFSPFITYPNIRKTYIKYRVWENHEPPAWVKELFLDQIGVNLKVSTEEEK